MLSMQLKHVEQSKRLDKVFSDLKTFESFTVLLNGSYIATGKYLGLGVIEALVLDNSEIADLLRCGSELSVDINLGNGEVLSASAIAEIVGNRSLKNSRNILFVRLPMSQTHRKSQFFEETNFRT